jgi:uncharacterized protein (TIGR03118 family)
MPVCFLFARHGVAFQENSVSRSSSLRRFVAGATVGFAFVAGCSDDSITNTISQLNTFNTTRLVADAAGAGAPTVDGFAVNPWGLAFSPNGILWSANNGTGTATLYDAAGNALSPVVSIPGPSFVSAGQPTGIVFNPTTSFQIVGGPALFVFAGLDGVISAWNQSSNDARLVVNRSSNGSVYTGLAIGVSNGASRLYAADFANGRVDMFDASFNFIGSFMDTSLPADYAPFGIQNIGGQLFVTYAKRDAESGEEVKGPGNGFVEVYAPDGAIVMRFASNGTLNAPWAVALAPADFGPFAGDILVGNFGDGTINAFDASTGAFIDVLRDANQNPIAVDGLWGLAFGPGASSTSLYFAAGIDDEQHGLIGVITPR